MTKVIGGAFGLYCFAVVIIFGIIRKATIDEALTRALVALVLGFLIGWLVFGSIGGAILAAGEQKPKEEKAEAEEEK